MDGLKKDGDALTRKMMARSEKRRNGRASSGSQRSGVESTPRKDQVRRFTTTLHDCLTTQDVGFAVNADNVVTSVLQNSPASALDADCRIGDRVISVDGVDLEGRPLAEVPAPLQQPPRTARCAAARACAAVSLDQDVAGRLRR